MKKKIEDDYGLNKAIKKMAKQEKQAEKEYTGKQAKFTKEANRKLAGEWCSRRGLYMTTGVNKNYMYTGVPVREFMEIATGPENRIPMVVQNRVNEKALEEL